MKPGNPAYNAGRSIYLQDISDGYRPFCSLIQKSMNRDVGGRAAGQELTYMLIDADLCISDNTENGSVDHEQHCKSGEHKQQLHGSKYHQFAAAVLVMLERIRIASVVRMRVGDHRTIFRDMAVGKEGLIEHVGTHDPDQQKGEYPGDDMFFNPLQSYHKFNARSLI